METYSHKCIKCSKDYKDNDIDPYLCDECKIEKKKIAEEIDKKIAMRPKREEISDLKRYDQAQKIRGFVSAKEFGI